VQRIKQKNSMEFDINVWYDEQIKGNVIFSYKGDISSNVIDQVLNTIEHQLHVIDEKPGVSKKLYNISVEAIQNLFHHVDLTPGNTAENGGKFIIFVIRKLETGYLLSTGNFIKNNRIKVLRDRIDQINFLSTEELKELYRIILGNEEFSEKGGGGLGIIDIAKRTGNKLNYSFNPMKNDYCFFCLEAVVT